MEAIVFGETLAKFPEEEVEDFATAADAVEEEAQNVSEMQDDNEEASDPPAPVLDHLKAGTTIRNASRACFYIASYCSCETIW